MFTSTFDLNHQNNFLNFIIINYYLLGNSHKNTKVQIIHEKDMTLKNIQYIINLYLEWNNGGKGVPARYTKKSIVNNANVDNII